MISGSRRSWLLPLALVGVAFLVVLQDAALAFAHGVARGRRVAHGRGRGVTGMYAATFDDDFATGGLENFQGSYLSLWTAFIILVACIPGVASTITRTGQAKYVEKVYVMPGSGAGGIEMRSIAGGVVAYFRQRNYAMEDSPQKGKVRFVGNLQGSVSQALYLTTVLFGAFVSLGFVLQALFPLGPLELGPNFWFAPCLLSPGAGWYYWGRAFRRDIVEMCLEESDDTTSITFSMLGDQETIEALQTGVRFQNSEGKLFQLMERGMDYQPGVLEGLGLEGKKEIYSDKTAA